MIGIENAETGYFDLQRKLDFLFRFKAVRCMIFVPPQIGSGFVVDVDDFIAERGGIIPEKLLHFLIYKRDVHRFLPLLVNQVKIDWVQLRCVKDMFRGQVKTSTRIQGVLNLKNVRVTDITQSFYLDFREKRISGNSPLGMMIKGKTGKSIPDFSELTQIDITFEEHSNYAVNPSLD